MEAELYNLVDEDHGWRSYSAKIEQVCDEVLQNVTRSHIRIFATMFLKFALTKTEEALNIKKRQLRRRRQISGPRPTYITDQLSPLTMDCLNC
ncbi:hypothetical protein NEPTK9_001337 [Candidatus Neptunochlamydia vexilliferae]|uniref:Uncharacterized protein n=1 Tax=Candidatus Neptunichlamydia vexilliferae TaxID=1651774 RepID=A0ABS0B0A5_9BACT|nr:hypothetical protein [Candidatus Neptunochlamydia vexilliferae]